MNDDRPLLLFDGICNLCNASVRFILKHENDHKIIFTPLQSHPGREILKQYTSGILKDDTILFIEHQMVFEKSEAVMKIGRHLKAPWNWIRVFRFIPVPVRDFFYDLIAKYRYRVFGKPETCMIPDSASRHRFL